MALPAGVTLQPIDGGTNYYAAHGFTYAANAGWDSPSFIPIGPWEDSLVTQSDATRWLDLGWNTAYTITGNTSASLARSNGIWLIQDSGQRVSGTGAETVGNLTADEPGTFAQGVSTPIGSTANSVQDGRFWWLNNTWNFVAYGALNGTPAPGTAAADLNTLVTTPNGTKRHIDVSSVDFYWFAGSRSGALLGQGAVLDNLSSMTVDQAARGSNYGDVISDERAATGGSTPIYGFVEDGGPYNEDTSAADYITPPELNWAVWSELIHGARGVIYFNHSFAGPAQSDDNLSQPYYQTVQPGQTVSMYAQMKTTDALVEQMAPVLNSSTALNYVTVNTPGYENGVVDSLFSGIEVLAKDDNGQFYIFADTRDSETQTHIPATFTLADKNATSVTVVGENRAIAVTNGVFTDTFATGATVHIYQVNDGYILWQNTNGQAAIWEMNGTNVIGGGTVSANPGPSWKAIGTGDFNDDGHSDILWQNTNGQAAIWEMNGTNVIGGGTVSANPGPSWKAIGTGDFNDDGHSDILRQNTNGQAAIWEMSGASLIGGGAVTPNPGPNWKAIGTGDFNKDGFSDILWQNRNTGQVSIWEMDGNNLIGGGPVTPNPGTAWQAVGTGDFNHDGFSDILLQNKNTGEVSVWEMDGTNLIGGGQVANPGANWQAIGTGAGDSDILLQNTSGQASIWAMNENTIAGGGPITPIPGPSWRAAGLT